MPAAFYSPAQFEPCLETYTSVDPEFTSEAADSGTADSVDSGAADSVGAGTADSVDSAFTGNA